LNLSNIRFKLITLLENHPEISETLCRFNTHLSRQIAVNENL